MVKMKLLEMSQKMVINDDMKAITALQNHNKQISFNVLMVVQNCCNCAAIYHINIILQSQTILQKKIPVWAVTELSS